MKKIVSGFLALFALLILANCSTQKTTTSTMIEREWMLVEFQDFSKEVMVANKANMNLTHVKSTSKFSAKMGCNNMFGTAIFGKNGTVKFSEVGSTMMFCDQAMELEAAFGKALPTMTKYKTEGHYMILSDNNGNAMKFLAADWD